MLQLSQEMPNGIIPSALQKYAREAVVAYLEADVAKHRAYHDMANGASQRFRQEIAKMESSQG